MIQRSPLVRTMGAVALLAAGQLAGSASARAVGDEHRAIMRAYAKCFVESDKYASSRRIMRAVMNSSPSSNVARDGADELAKSWCPTEIVGHGEKFFWLNYSAQAIRGQLFRAVFVRDLMNAPVVPPSGNTLPSWRLPEGDSYRSTQLFGECIVARMPRESVAAVSTRVTGSPEDRAAYAALRPAMSDCVAPGETLRLSTAYVEAAIAEALYHFSVQADGQSVTAGVH